MFQGLRGSHVKQRTTRVKFQHKTQQTERGGTCGTSSNDLVLTKIHRKEESTGKNRPRSYHTGNRTRHYEAIDPFVNPLGLFGRKNVDPKGPKRFVSAGLLLLGPFFSLSFREERNFLCVSFETIINSTTSTPVLRSPWLRYTYHNLPHRPR